MILVPRILDARVFSSDLIGIGVITKIFFDIDQRRLIALSVKPGPFRRTKILQVSDIELVDNDKIILSKNCSLMRKKEIEHKQRVVSKASLIGGKVSSTKGEYLGKVRSAAYRLVDGRLENISISKNAFVTMTSGGYLVKGDDILSVSGVEIEVDEEKLISSGSKFTDQMSVLGTKMASLRREAENLITSRERSFIIGKISGLDIIDEEGNKIIVEGEIITDDHIGRASNANRLHQLTLAAGKAEIRSKLKNRKDK